MNAYFAPIFNAPTFNAPWEAQVFALVTTLRDRDAFTAGEWSTALGQAIRAAQDAGDHDTGTTAFAHWAVALETLLAAKGLASRVLIDARAGAPDAPHTPGSL